MSHQRPPSSAPHQRLRAPGDGGVTTGWWQQGSEIPAGTSGMAGYARPSSAGVRQSWGTPEPAQREWTGVGTGTSQSLGVGEMPTPLQTRLLPHPQAAGQRRPAQPTLLPRGTSGARPYWSCWHLSLGKGWWCRRARELEAGGTEAAKHSQGEK